jgi:hypothetical protein
MATGNNFEFGGSNAGGDMTPEEMLAAKGVYAGPSKEGKSYYIVHGKDGKKQKIPMSEGVTGLEDASGRFPEQGYQVYSPRKVRYKVIGRKATQRLASSRVKRRLFL